MCAWAERAAAAALALGVALAAPAAGQRYGLGTPATAEQIAGWDIDVRPDGAGLPPGRGTAAEGEALYMKRCASCHGEFGEARGRYPALMGGRGTLASEDPVKTVGSYWPYATTVFDYVRRAMPFGHAQSLSDDEAYAITAYVLNLSEVVGYEDVMDAKTLPAVKMPNRGGFVADDRPDTLLGEPCMRECRGAVKVIGKARIIDVTPETQATSGGEPARSPVAAGAAADAARGKALWQQCAACQSLEPGEHRVGPSLHAVLGRKAAAADGFDRYSRALASAELVWNEENLAKFLRSPQDFIAGTTMPYAGMGDEADIRALLTWLRQASQ